MSEFVERQIQLLSDLTSQYKNNQLSLNKLVLKMEVTLALQEMSSLSEKVCEKVAILEEINAYLIDGGKQSEEIKNKILNIVLDIEKTLKIQAKDPSNK